MPSGSLSKDDYVRASGRQITDEAPKQIEAVQVRTILLIAVPLALLVLVPVVVYFISRLEKCNLNIYKKDYRNGNHNHD